MQVKLSVVIPVYNRPFELRRALLSLETQTSKNFEVIVCDDGSKDSISNVTEDFCNQLDIQYIRIDKSGGPARPRNVAIKAAKYNWISFLDSDDWWVKNRVEEVTKVINNNINYDVFYHKLKAVGAHRKSSLWRNKYLGSKIGEDHFSHLMTRGNCLPLSAVIIRRESYFRNGIFNEDKKLEDYDYWLRLAHSGRRFYFINRCLGYYWLGNDGISLNYNKAIKDYMILYQNHMHFVKSSDKDATESFFMSQLAAYNWALGNHSEAYRLLKNATHLRTTSAKIRRLIKMQAIKFYLW